MEKDSPSCASGMGANGPSRRPYWDRFCSELGCVFIWRGRHSYPHPARFSPPGKQA